MSEILQIATLISAVAGWLTVIVGGFTVWNRITIRMSQLQSKLDNLCSNFESNEKREQEIFQDHENRLRILEKA